MTDTCASRHPIADYDLSGTPITCTLPAGHGGSEHEDHSHDAAGETIVWNIRSEES